MTIKKPVKFTNLKSKIKFRDVTYLDNETDHMWLNEAGKLCPWFFGKGADIGCGMRSILHDVIRVDADKNVKPEILSAGDDLLFKDGELDYICSIHSFEHFADQKKTLKEWLRCLKSGGIIGIVHPDVSFTKVQAIRENNESLKQNPFNLHYFEKTHDEFMRMIETWKDMGFDIIDHGMACIDWSFYLIIQKR